MKTILPTLLVSLMVSACAAAAPEAPVASAATQAPAAAPAVAQAAAVPAAPAPAPQAVAAAPAMDLAAGQKAFEQNCFSCHDQATILAQGGRTRADWQEVVIMMQDRGMSASPQDTQRIIDYLAATHPPKS